MVVADSWKMTNVMAAVAVAGVLWVVLVAWSWWDTSYWLIAVAVTTITYLALAGTWLARVSASRPLVLSGLQRAIDTGLWSPGLVPTGGHVVWSPWTPPSPGYLGVLAFAMSNILAGLLYLPLWWLLALSAAVWFPLIPLLTLAAFTVGKDRKAERETERWMAQLAERLHADPCPPATPATPKPLILLARYKGHPISARAQSSGGSVCVDLCVLPAAGLPEDLKIYLSGPFNAGLWSIIVNGVKRTLPECTTAQRFRALMDAATALSTVTKFDDDPKPIVMASLDIAQHRSQLNTFLRPEVSVDQVLTLLPLLLDAVHSDELSRDLIALGEPR